MNNLQFRLIDTNCVPQPERKVLFTPTMIPEIHYEFQSVGDSYQLITDASGTITASVVPSIYKLAEARGSQ